ncbi:tRNA pseudouridine(55) synthase TruB [Cryomorpha ignava]|uniref:tRNA pseudouridine synthase B n=1 Tax=Cryomorpha ignava TaxID=101383 RepID=A0A7K3WSB1_9FLAO|nr:tRNA pseudouridine(55) synthase TruB [Cryomorpha ignava]NEN24579.1 tRNA pseudouridine(55) synthase TruB [Cryomorpha ignava]
MKKDYAQLSAEDFLEGQLLLIDKPLEWTSFDAVKKIRYSIRKKFNLKKIKVGHAGTLDPLATGLLIICTGRFTKKITELTLEEKSYSGTFTIGATTASYDLESEVENKTSTDHITTQDVEAAVAELTGKQEQVPPIFSAKKVDGKRAYESARKGEEVILKANTVEIKTFDVDCSELPLVRFSIICSKGTYIRSIARDLGEKLKTGAYLSELRRDAIGHFNLDNAIDPIAFQELLEGEKG